MVIEVEAAGVWYSERDSADKDIVPPAKSVNSPKFTFNLVVPLSLIARPGSDGSRKILLLPSLRILFSTVQLPIVPPVALIVPVIVASDTVNPVEFKRKFGPANWPPLKTI